MTDTGGTSPGELGGMVAGALAILGALGATGKWLAGWLTTRSETRATRNARWEADLDAREHAIEARIAESLSKCEERCAVVDAKYDKVRIAILLILPELHRAAPNSPALKQVGSLLRDVFPISLDQPDDMASQIAAIDAHTRDAERTTGGIAPHKIWEDEI